MAALQRRFGVGLLEQLRRLLVPALQPSQGAEIPRGEVAGAGRRSAAVDGLSQLTLGFIESSELRQRQAEASP